mmetsp:Transcript_5187/g.15520  ORF Transcript_5187/g.15520 Transcript_5187/m.15520 type:complete len:360 (-) Transcript_5187:52-1131(-)
MSKPEWAAAGATSALGSLLAAVLGVCVSILVSWATAPAYGPFTVQQLATYTGEAGSNGRILIAVRGRVFDVTPGRTHYAKGRTYHYFAARDATRGFVGKSDPPMDRVDDLSPRDMEDVNGWLWFYDHHDRYRYVGWLEDGRDWREWHQFHGLRCCTDHSPRQMDVSAAGSVLQLQPLTEAEYEGDEIAYFGRGEPLKSPGVTVTRERPCNFPCGYLDTLPGTGQEFGGFRIASRDPEAQRRFYTAALGLVPCKHDDTGLCGAHSPMQLCFVNASNRGAGRYSLQFAVVDPFRLHAHLSAMKVSAGRPYNSTDGVITVVAQDPEGNELVVQSQADLEKLASNRRKTIRREERARKKAARS